MKPMEFDRLTAAQCDSAHMLRASSKRTVLDRVRGIRQVCRQLFGIPDYERYLAHTAEHHPGTPVLSRRDFCARAIERKYGNSGPRCC